MPKRVDGNQAELVQLFRELGASVVDLHEVGRGCPDIAVGYGGTTCLVEIKMPGAKLNKREQAFRDAWQGKIAIVYDRMGVARLLVEMRQPHGLLRDDYAEIAY